MTTSSTDKTESQLGLTSSKNISNSLAHLAASASLESSSLSLNWLPDSEYQSGIELASHGLSSEAAGQVVDPARSRKPNLAAFDSYSRSTKSSLSQSYQLPSPATSPRSSLSYPFSKAAPVKLPGIKDLLSRQPYDIIMHRHSYSSSSSSISELPGFQSHSRSNSSENQAYLNQIYSRDSSYSNHDPYPYLSGDRLNGSYGYGVKSAVDPHRNPNNSLAKYKSSYPDSSQFVTSSYVSPAKPQSVNTHSTLSEDLAAVAKYSARKFTIVKSLPQPVIKYDALKSGKLVIRSCGDCSATGTSGHWCSDPVTVGGYICQKCYRRRKRNGVSGVALYHPPNRSCHDCQRVDSKVWFRHASLESKYICYPCHSVEATQGANCCSACGSVKSTKWSTLPDGSVVCLKCANQLKRQDVPIAPSNAV